MSLEKAIPLAYFITFTCYGTWLHGGKATSVDKYHNQFGTDFLQPNQYRCTSTKNYMKDKPYLLNKTARETVLTAIINVCTHKQWILVAAHVRTNHIHLIIHANTNPELILNTLKSYASRALNNFEYQIKRWTRHGSTRYLWSDAEVLATIHYVINEQGTPMAIFQR